MGLMFNNLSSSFKCCLKIADVDDSDLFVDAPHDTWDQSTTIFEQDYFERIGFTGRAGVQGVAITLLTQDQAEQANCCIILPFILIAVACSSPLLLVFVDTSSSSDGEGIIGLFIFMVFVLTLVQLCLVALWPFFGCFLAHSLHSLFHQRSRSLPLQTKVRSYGTANHNCTPVLFPFSLRNSQREVKWWRERENGGCLL